MNSLKFEIETWATALQAYDAEDWDSALELFAKIADNSKILTNIGLIYASLGEHEIAIENFHGATELDGYLAIAYFQAGVSHFLLGQFEAALQEFDDAFSFLRGNEAINYEQLGLKYQLHACAVMFNQGITMINMGETEKGLAMLRKASGTKTIPDHDVVDEAIRDAGDGYTVFSIPVGVLYRPNEKKVANMKARDWMGKARLISDSDARNEFLPSSSAAARAQALREATEATSPERAGLSRSKSAAVAKAMQSTDESSPPRAANIVRSASASASTAIRPPPAPKVEEPLPAIQPLAIARSKSTRTPPSGAVQPLNPMTIGRRPTLKVNADVERPPTPPQSESPRESRDRDQLPVPATKSMLRSQYGESIFDNYLTGGDDGASIKGMGFGKSALLRKNTAASTIVPPLPRAPSRHNTISKRPTTLKSDEDDAYLDDERRGSFELELKRIRIKLFFKDDVRGMVVMPNIPFAELLENVCAKFSYEMGGLRMKFQDEDGTKVSIRDDGDWEMAVETVRESGTSGGSSVSSAKGEGKLSIWCEEDYQ